MRALFAIAFLTISVSASAGEFPDSASAMGAVDDGEPRASTQLVLDHSSAAPGDQIRVGVLFNLAPEWHVYGQDPGEAGLPTSIVWGRDGLAVGETQWPPTETFVDPSGRIRTTGYSERVVLEADAVVTGNGDALQISVEVDYLACRIKCLPGSAKLTRELAIGTSTPADPVVLALFENFGRSRTLTAPPTPVPTNPGTAPAAPIPMWQVLLLALLGGVLLNLMPCVFPVLALKVFGFVSTAGRREVALPHAAAYSAGILASMVVLAGVVIVVQSAGEAVGWGFQFQEPSYLVALTLFVVLFSLNLFGLFDVPSLPLPSAHGEPSHRRSFVDGGLAVVLATPCSAPFLGTALGFALAASAPVILATFLTVGVGLALPFLLACTIPGIGQRLPQPGPWMETMERGLGFVLLGTAVWLLWVFGRVSGVDGLAALLACAVSMSVGAWVYGRVQYRAGRARALGAVAALILTVAPVVVLAPWAFEASPATGASSGRWQAWDEARIAQEQAAGRVVFVDFTADWCITCKVNERVALSSESVWHRFDEAGVVAMKADWTRRDETIRSALARFGRAGVPLYLVYPPGGGEPKILGEVLTESMVLSAIDELAR